MHASNSGWVGRYTDAIGCSWQGSSCSSDFNISGCRCFCFDQILLGAVDSRSPSLTILRVTAAIGLATDLAVKQRFIIVGYSTATPAVGLHQASLVLGYFSLAVRSRCQHR